MLSDRHTEIFDSFLLDAQTQMDGLRIVRRVTHRYPFDTVAQALWMKTLNLGSAVSLLLKAGLGQEAYGLTRSIVEIAYTLRYITVSREDQWKRTIQFIWHSKKDRELWLALMLKQPLTENGLRDVERMTILNHLEPDELSAHRHWSGERQFAVSASELLHPLDPRTQSRDEVKLTRACDYYHPSVFLHASCAGSESLVDLNNESFSSQLQGVGKPYFTRRTTSIAWQYTTHICNYVLYGMNLIELSSSLDFMKEYVPGLDNDGLPIIERKATVA